MVASDDTCFDTERATSVETRWLQKLMPSHPHRLWQLLHCASLEILLQVFTPQFWSTTFWIGFPFNAVTDATTDAIADAAPDANFEWQRRGLETQTTFRLRSGNVTAECKQWT